MYLAPNSLYSKGIIEVTGRRGTYSLTIHLTRFYLV